MDCQSNPKTRNLSKRPGNGHERFSALSGGAEIPSTSQVSETPPQPTVVGFQNTTPEDFANDINMGNSTAGSTRPTTPTNAHKRLWDGFSMGRP
jgi:hypothetical protein